MDIEFRRLDRRHVPAVRSLMEVVASRLPSADLFAMDNEPRLIEIAENYGEILGAFAEDTLVAYSVLSFPGIGSANLAREYGVPEKEWLRVAVLDSTVVHESARGRGLQRYFHQWREKRALEYGCLHLFSTVHPDNHYSKRNLELAGLTVRFTREMYGGVLRHCMAKRIGFDGL